MQPIGYSEVSVLVELPKQFLLLSLIAVHSACILIKGAAQH